MSPDFFFPDIFFHDLLFFILKIYIILASITLVLINLPPIFSLTYTNHFFYLIEIKKHLNILKIILNFFYHFFFLNFSPFSHFIFNYPIIHFKFFTRFFTYNSLFLIIHYIIFHLSDFMLFMLYLLIRRIISVQLPFEFLNPFVLFFLMTSIFLSCCSSPFIIFMFPFSFYIYPAFIIMRSYLAMNF